MTSVSPWCIKRETNDPRPEVLAIVLSLLFATLPAVAQTVAGDTFADGKDGAKVHVASGFVCPAKIGAFERDAVGESDPQAGVGFCAYGALDGVYGTIKLIPLHGAYDAKQSLDGDFAEQEGTGGKPVAEGNITVAPGTPPLVAYARTYETAKLEDLHYRVLFTGAAIGNWAVETTIEFAEPRDVPDEMGFLHAVYAAARRGIGKTP
ncbi:MAG TPA: hypothetical protein VHX61_17620 [Rhizomicrobium sp.]|nr:hypothetical protein [Rhizomicrobium sp.]